MIDMKRGTRTCYLPWGESRTLNLFDTRILVTNSTGSVTNGLNLDQIVKVNLNGFVAGGVKYFWYQMTRDYNAGQTREITALELFNTYFIESEAKSKTLERRA